MRDERTFKIIGAAIEVHKELKKKYKLILVAGTRPNFMKIAPLMRIFENHSKIESIIVHTGQHYDEKLSKLF